MKNNILKKIICGLFLSMTFANANAVDTGDVIRACVNAYDADEQQEACITNVCTYYGCE